MKKTLLLLMLGVLFVATTLSAQTGRRLPGLARDIAIGGNWQSNDYAIWMVEKVTRNIRSGGYVYKWDNNTEQWQRMSTQVAESITVNNKGNPWIVDGEGKIYQWQFNPQTSLYQFYHRPGQEEEAMLARDIGIGEADFWAHIISRIDGNIYKWTGTGWAIHSEFKKKGVARRISVDNNGSPWVVTDNGTIYRYDSEKSIWVNMSDKITPRKPKMTYLATDIGCSITPEGEIWFNSKGNLQEGGRLYYCMLGEYNWYLGPDRKGVRVSAFGAEILVVNGSGQIWWVSLW